jgi:hypothetical protein
MRLLCFNVKNPALLVCQAILYYSQDDDISLVELYQLMSIRVVRIYKVARRISLVQQLW